jgi:hypothetical protein
MTQLTQTHKGFKLLCSVDISKMIHDIGIWIRDDLRTYSFTLIGREIARLISSIGQLPLSSDSKLARDFFAGAPQSIREAIE